LTSDATSAVEAQPTRAAPPKPASASGNGTHDRKAPPVAFPVIASKVTPPVPRVAGVTRTALIDRLRGQRDVPVITIVAPAGYGKTTLLHQWAERDPRPFAWLAIDAHDNDPGVLLTYLALALDRITPVDPAVFRSLAAPRSDPMTAAGPVLQALRRASRPAVLVIDDLHELDDGSCRDVLAQIVDRMPAGWQVALAGRGPLPTVVARLRAEGRVAEVSTTDLAMDHEEARELLRSAGIDLTMAAVTELNRDLEGWPAALYLAGLALRSAPGGDAASDVEDGTDRFLVDYVQSEVLSRLSTDDVEFLTRTAVLDRLSGPLCDAVLGTTDSASRLDRLERDNMLVVPLDHTCTWYRCHRVLRDMAYTELERRERDRIAALRRRAADWYEANGMPQLAIEQAMAVDDAERVCAIATAWGQVLYQRGLATTARRWFDWIDEHDLITAHPDLAATGALAHLVDGRTATAERWLDAAQCAATRDGTAALRGRVAMLTALACRDGIDAMLGDAEQAVALIPLDDPYRGLALLVLGMAQLHTSQRERADAVLADAVEAAEDRAATPSVAIALAERALLALGDGRTADASGLAERARAVVDAAGLDGYGISALIYAAVARTHLEQGDATTAKRALVHAQRLQAHLNHSLPWYTVQVRLEIARCYLALTDASGARAMLREALKVVRRRPRLGPLVDEIATLQHQLDALHANMAGASALTAAELRLLPLLATHLSFREIGARLFISPNTVKTEAISIYRKLGVTCRSEAIEHARQLGLLPD
jgi:LuxR family maltose regulon positive regulatory protein